MKLKELLEEKMDKQALFDNAIKLYFKMKKHGYNTRDFKTFVETYPKMANKSDWSNYNEIMLRTADIGDFKNFKTFEALEMIKPIFNPHFYREMKKAWPTGVKYSKDAIKYLRDKSKKLPKKELKL